MLFVLWIDDEPYRYRKVREIIEESSLGVKITLVFAHGREQVEHYLEGCSTEGDLVILDHDMPLFNGMKVVEEFLVFKNIPVLLCSNNWAAREEQKKKLREFGVPATVSEASSDYFPMMLDECLEKIWRQGEER